MMAPAVAALPSVAPAVRICKRRAAYGLSPEQPHGALPDEESDAAFYAADAVAGAGRVDGERAGRVAAALVLLAAGEDEDVLEAPGPQKSVCMSMTMSVVLSGRRSPS
jgi:hypothetical protein